MRSAPALHLSVNRFGLWRAGLLLLVACASGSRLAWWWAQPVPPPSWANATAGLGVLLSMACLAGLWRDRPLTLRSDRQCWFLAHTGPPECAGGLSVAVDLGSSMPLRFIPQAADPGATGMGRPVWIALQRRGLESQWHALRCGLFAARPTAPVPVASGDG